ncbi:MAG: efflux RND transporter periplasmic adaptor subunit [Salinibacter sp.]
MTPPNSTASPDAPSSDGTTTSDSPLLQDTSSSGGGTGEGVDRKIETSFFTPKRIAMSLAALLAVGALAYGVWTTATGGQVYNVDRSKVTISTVTRGDFQEFIAVTGTAVPEQTVYLGAVEGGRVEEIYLEEGAMVEAGDPILRLSNNDLRLQLARTEARLAEQRSRMQQIRMDMEQRRLQLRRDLAQIRNQIRQLERQFRRQKQLHKKNLIADQRFEQTRDDLQYQRQRLKLTRSAYRQDSLRYRSRLDQQRTQQQRLDQRYEAMQEAIASLTVRAPIDGQLTSLNAELGQIISAGTRVGQVDKIDSYKLRAQIDEFYIERVRHGQTATTQALGDTTYTLTVDRVYPEVENGRFEVDLAFTGASPSDLRRGQTVRLKLQLGQPQQATLLPRGGFYQSTGGNWAYVLTESGDAAVRRPIRLGRQNPNYFEVLGGLTPGDKVITSSYDTFGDADRLSLE